MAKRPMVELPAHVSRIRAKGRDYYYFQRGRGTPLAGLRTALPSDPHSIAFWQAYRNAVGHAEEAAGKTFNDLISAYETSPDFRSRSKATKRAYERYLKILRNSWGPLLISGLKPKHALKMRDVWAEKPVAANMLLAVAKLLVNWGIPREFSDTNPFAAIPKLRTEQGGARPWPFWAYDLIDTHAPEDIRRAVWLARYTGQRQADVLRMSKADIEDGGIKLTQQKTGKKLWVPLHQALKTEMEGWEVLPPWNFVQTPKGGPYSAGNFRTAWANLMAPAAGRIRNEGLTFHGLRASSVVALREVGCGDRDIESITGMSPHMVTRYSRFADQRSLAKAAILRLERNKP